MGIADLHAHTRHTSWGDGNQTVEELLRFVERETDLDIFAITDHDDTAAARAAWKLHQQGNYRFALLPGVEVTNQAGHLLCYFPSGGVVDIPSLRPFWWTVRFAQRHGAVCVPAHPIYPPWLVPVLRRGWERGLRVDAVEAINAAIGERAQRRLDGVAREFVERVALVGNSDAHHQAAIGAAYTRFPGKSVDDFLRALADRQTEPVYVRVAELDAEARRFTQRRSITRPGWVGNLWREASARSGSSERD
ncbi:MAG: PHP-associated domain-containing protein [Chloroflexota bacterium]